MCDNLAYREEQRDELIGGQVVAMSPRPTFNHNQISSNIFWLFKSWLRGRTCTPIADGTDLYLDGDNRFVPDMMIVCDRDKVKHDGVHGAPDLVVEVLSPGTMRQDKTTKKTAYARCGVREYWIVSPGDRSIEIYRRDGAGLELCDIYALHPDWELEKMSEEERAAVVTHFKCSLYDDFELPLEEIFSGLLP